MSFLRTATKTLKKTGGDRYKLPDDKKDHAVRIVPFHPDGSWGFRVVQHWTPDPSGDSTFDKSFICRQDQPRAHALKDGEDALPTFGLECPFELKIAEVLGEIDSIGDARDEKSKANIKLLRSMEWALKNADSHMLQLVDREDPSGVKEFMAPPGCYEQILNCYMDAAVVIAKVEDREALFALPDEEIPDLFDVNHGYDILLRKTPKSTGRGFVFHATLASKKSPLASTPQEIKMLLEQVKDPVRHVKGLIAEQENDVDAAVEALIQRVIIKSKSAKPIKGAEVSDNDMFKNARTPGGNGRTQRDTSDDLPHLPPLTEGGGDDEGSPEFGNEDPDEAAFTQAQTPKVTTAKETTTRTSVRPKSKLADALADLDNE